MENSSISKTLKPVKQMMSLIGIWPEQFPSLMYRIKGSVSMFFVAAFGITTLIQVVTNFSDVKSTSFCLCCAMSALQTLDKYVFLLLNRTNFFNMLRYFSDTTYKNHLNIYVQQKIRMCSQLRLMFLSASFGTGILIVVAPLFEAKLERPVPVPFPVDMKNQPFVIYFSVWCFESIGVILTCLGTGCFDGMIFSFIAIASAQLRILREKMIRSTDAYSTDCRHLHVDNAVNNVLKECIIQHLAIERYVATIENTFQYVFLIQMIISLLVTCLIGFNFVLIPIISIDFGRCLLFFIAAAIQLILFCVPGNEIILQSEKIRDACYMTNWDQCGPTVRKTLFIIMERSKRPFTLTAANFMKLSLDTLMKVLKSAFSYFTVLQHMYSNSNKI